MTGLVMTIFSFNYLKGINLFDKSRYFLVVYDNVEGLVPSNPVTINGYKIGNVQKISFSGDDNNNLEIKLNKTKLILDPFDFKINAKTIGTKLTYKGKDLELEYVKTQISLISLIKNKIVSSNIQLSTRAILLKDLVTFVRAIRGNPELFILEQAIKKGLVVVNLELNFDENGKINQDYKINGSLKDGNIDLFKIYNFKKVNLLFNIKKNIFPCMYRLKNSR